MGRRAAGNGERGHGHLVECVFVVVICEGVSSRLEPILEWGRRTTIEEGSRLPVRAGFAGPTYIKGAIEFTAMPHT